MKEAREQPKWLIETQNNSWNPELLISGISILFIFSFGDRLNDLAIGIIQEYGVNPALTLASLLYVTLAVQTLKYAFVLHLLMRGVWVGLVGLNYTFPQGIRREKLPKMSQQDFFLDDLKDTIDIIMRVERICSSIFSIAFTIVGISAWIMLLLVPAIILSSLGVPLTAVFVALVVLLVIISTAFPLYNLLLRKFDKKVPFLKGLALMASRSQYLLFFRESLLTFQTNMNSKLAMVVFFGFFLLSGMQTGTLITQTIDFIKYSIPERSLIPGMKSQQRRSSYRYQDPMLYLDNHKSYQRIQKAAIPSFVQEGGQLPIYCAEFDWDWSAVKAADTLEIHRLVDVAIDSMAVPVSWSRSFLPTSGQRVWVAHVDTKDLSRGEHLLQLDKWIWHPYKKEPIRFEGWCRIRFIVD